jgi:hypothetical protein
MDDFRLTAGVARYNMQSIPFLPMQLPQSEFMPWSTHKQVTLEIIDFADNIIDPRNIEFSSENRRVRVPLGFHFDPKMDETDLMTEHFERMVERLENACSRYEDGGADADEACRKLDLIHNFDAHRDGGYGLRVDEDHAIAVRCKVEVMASIRREGLNNIWRDVVIPADSMYLLDVSSADLVNFSTLEASLAEVRVRSMHRTFSEENTDLDRKVDTAERDNRSISWVLNSMDVSKFPFFQLDINKLGE